MNDKDQLADQLHRAWAGGAWHGPAIAEALAGISPQQAAKACDQVFTTPVFPRTTDAELHYIAWAIRQTLADLKR